MAKFVLTFTFSLFVILRCLPSPSHFPFSPIKQTLRNFLKEGNHNLKVNELTQEFHFAHPLTKVRMNNIFNSYFYGSVLWDLFGIEALRMEKSWNVSQRIMLGIPRNSHRCFIEPLSDTKHIMFSLFKRFLKYIGNIESSSKSVIRRMLRTVRCDCRSNTGRNLRKLMRISGNMGIDELNLISNEIPVGEEWKIKLAEELIEMKNGIMDVDILTSEKVNEILTYIVT